MCILLQFGLSTWIHRSHIRGDNRLDNRVATLCAGSGNVAISSNPAVTPSSQIVMLSKPCLLIAASHAIFEMLCPLPVPRFCARSEMVCVAWCSFSAWSLQGVVLCQCLGVAHGSKCLGVLVCRCLVALRSFTEPQPSHATVCVGVWRLNEGCMGHSSRPDVIVAQQRFEAAVDVLSDAHVHPSGKNVVYHMSSW